MTDRSDLMRRFSVVEVEALRRRFRRALDENADGQALLATALERAALGGFEAWCEMEGEPTADDWPESVEQGWSHWEAQRQLTPEAASWPERLAGRDHPAAARALDAAERELLEAGTELGMTGAVAGRSASRALRQAGRQAAEAGAALRCALDVDDASVQPEVVDVVAPDVERRLPSGDTVSVATAANIAECELLQGRLAELGIPSTWRRSGGDVPHFLAAGYRDVHVPRSAEQAARALLAFESPSADDEREQRPTRKVGLERTPLRILSKVVAVIVVTGLVAWDVWAAALAGSVSGVAVILGWVALVASIVTWSERSRRA